MKKTLFLLFTLLAAVLLSCAAEPSEPGTVPDAGSETEPSAPVLTLIREIPAQKKGYYGDPYSSRVIDLSDYVDAGGADVTYTAESSDEEAVSVSVDGSLLTATVHSGEAEATVTVTASADGVDPLTVSFPMTGFKYNIIACVGDSHTEMAEGYPVYLNKLFAEIRVAPFGSGGAALTGLVPDEDGYLLRPIYTKSLAYKPDMVVSLFGSNDVRAWDAARDVFISDYLAFLDSYRAVNPNATFIIITPPTMAHEPANTLIKEEIAPALRTMCEENDLLLVDFTAAMCAMENDGFSLLRPEDGIHLTVEGANMLADMVADVIRQQ